MANKFKNIVLLHGLHPVSDYHFKMVKSLLSSELKLTKKMQEDCDKIEFAELMEKKFRNDAGLGKLISLFKKMSDLQSIVDTLEKEKAKVLLKMKCKGKEKHAVKRSKQDESSSTQSLLNTEEESVKPESKDVPLSKKKKKSTKKMDDLQKNMVDQKMGLLPETSAASTGLQTPHKPPPISSRSSSTQTPQVAPETPSSSQQTPKLTPEPSNSLHTGMLPPAAASSSLQTAQGTPEPPSNLQHLWMPPSALSNFQTPLTTPPSSLQTPHIPLGPSSSLQTPQMLPGSATSSPLPMKPKLKPVPTEPSKECGYQKGPKEVMVLKVTEPFTYAVREEEQKIIHATVATENEFFRVKVFDITVKDKFTPKNIITISDYFGRDGFLEVYKTSTVSNVSADRQMEILPTLIHRAKATPKIRQLWSQSKGTYVNGIFTVCKKKVRQGCIFYEIQDNTGRMEVVVYGRLANIYCEEGDKLNLTCFEVAKSVDSWQLRSVLHSHLKVIKARKSKTQPIESGFKTETSLESQKPGWY
ncbi:interferon-activable protein 203 isoform X2 [Heterocephalus glaber]|uniref:Interferon-activable protein 203 isoform X2 n=1 Tax=Heterocephalus glaber TaxID=10181 RepID=A0AAX6R0Z6_HETGA|nr:interferon-activable protein 203 isoform X2 [Heterocephalus glaber]